MKRLDINTWKRKDHYHYFKDYDQPFFNLIAKVDISELKRFTEENKLSFFLTSFYVLLKCSNDIECFRYRMRDDGVIIHDEIVGGCPILKNDRTFSFTNLPYNKSFKTYYDLSKEKIDTIKESAPFRYDPRDTDDMFHSSIVPWLHFEHFEHAKNLNTNDSAPKFVLGKYELIQDKWMMPLSVSAHHALMDGIDVTDFFELYERIASEPELHLS